MKSFFWNFIFLLIFMTMSFLSLSQQSKIDSILNVIESTDDDTTKYDLVNRIGFTYIFRFPNKFLPFAKKHLKAAWKDDFKSGVANIYNNIGIYYDVQGMRDSSELYFNKALNYSQENKLDDVHSKALNNLGMFHWNKGEFENAIRYFFESLDLLNKTEEDEVKREKFASTSRNNIGLIYQEMGLYEKAITSHLIALEIRERYDIRGDLPTSYTNLGICYRNLSQRDSAFFYLNKSLATSKEVGLTKEQKIAHDNLGNIYQDAGEIKEAVYHYSRSIELGEELPNTSNSDIITIGNLIHLYNDLNQWSNSLDAIERANEILANDPDAQNFAKDLYKNGAITYFNTGKIDNGEEFLNRFIQIQDSLFAKENAEQLASYEAKFETQEKERQLLEERTKSQKLEIDNIASEKAIVRQRNILYSVIIIFLFVVSLGVFVYFRKRQRLREEKNQALIKAKEDNIRSVISAQEKERERLARELHDGLVQEIRMLKTELDDASVSDQEIQAKLAKRIVNLKTDARNLAYAIMPTALRKAGLVEAVKDLVNNSFSSQSTRAQFFSAHDHIETSDQVKNNTYRIIQEAINNIIKHSECSNVDVSINQLKSTLILTIEDDGKGFDTKTMNNSIGLKSMRSRAEIMNGSLEIESSIEGTTVTVRVGLG